MWGLTFVSILILSLLPGGAPESDIGSSWIWNLGHVPAYAVLSGVTVLVLAKRGPVDSSARWGIGLAVVSLAIALELLQPLVGRTASIADVGYGAFGAVTGIWMQALLAKKLRIEAAKRDARNGC
jgi:VanZ family protein